MTTPLVIDQDYWDSITYSKDTIKTEAKAQRLDQYDLNASKPFIKDHIDNLDDDALKMEIDDLKTNNWFKQSLKAHKLTKDNKIKLCIQCHESIIQYRNEKIKKYAKKPKSTSKTKSKQKSKTTSSSGDDWTPPASLTIPTSRRKSARQAKLKQQQQSLVEAPTSTDDLLSNNDNDVDDDAQDENTLLNPLNDTHIGNKSSPNDNFLDSIIKGDDSDDPEGAFQSGNEEKGESSDESEDDFFNTNSDSDADDDAPMKRKHVKKLVSMFTNHTNKLFNKLNQQINNNQTSSRTSRKRPLPQDIPLNQLSDEQKLQLCEELNHQYGIKESPRKKQKLNNGKSKCIPSVSIDSVTYLPLMYFLLV